VPEVDLESHRDERVGKGEHKVGGYCSAPAPDDEVGKLERWVVFGLEVLHVNGHIEGEAKERYNDKIYNRD
jgi:hypothetical protein